MSNPTPQGGEPVWADSNIHNALYPHVKNIGYTDWVHLSDAQFIAQLVRDSYEATIAAQAARLLELERQLSICSGYADKLRGEKSELAEQYYRLRAGLPEKDGNYE